MNLFIDAIMLKNLLLKNAAADQQFDQHYGRHVRQLKLFIFYAIIWNVTILVENGRKNYLDGSLGSMDMRVLFLLYNLITTLPAFWEA